MLTKSTEYAIRSLVYIQLTNWAGKRPGVVDIAREIEAPNAYTAKILQALTKQNLVGSMKGRGGGFFFKEDQAPLPLYNVIVAMEGDSSFHKCGFGLKECSSDNPCPLHDKYQEIRDGFYDIVKYESVQSLSQKVKDGTANLNRLNYG